MPGMKEGIRAGSSGVPRAGELPGKPRHMLAAEEVHVVHELIHDVFLILYEEIESRHRIFPRVVLPESRRPYLEDIVKIAEEADQSLIACGLLP
jgi:hypothetical protein